MSRNELRFRFSHFRISAFPPSVWPAKPPPLAGGEASWKSLFIPPKVAW